MLQQQQQIEIEKRKKKRPKIFEITIILINSYSLLNEWWWKNANQIGIYLRKGVYLIYKNIYKRPVYIILY